MSEHEAPHPWLDDQAPHDPAYAARQLDGLLHAFADRPRRILDLGCGIGRVMRPLLEAGHAVTGIERRASYVEEARDTLREFGLDERGEVVHADFLTAWPWADDEADAPVFDAVVCLGNTLMAVVDPDDAFALFGRIAARLAPGGEFIVDDFPHEFWPEVSDGSWLSGISEDGSMQLIWAAGDAVLVLRSGDEVDPDRWSIGPDEPRVRLWSLGALGLAARGAGLSGPCRDSDAALLRMRRDPT